MTVFPIPLRARRRALLAGLALTVLAGCAAPPDRATAGPAPGDADVAWLAQLQRWQGVPVLLLGEQHDVPAHQQWEQATVQWLAARGWLAALVLEMAEAGTAADGLPPTASADAVRARLRWNERLWPWEHYAGAIMAAVAAGVPVRGANLDAAALRAALQDATLDAHLPPPALARQRRAIEDGHCGLLPPARVQPMVRVQLARDASFARQLQQSLQPGRTALLLAGGGHVLRDLGVPTWLPPGLESKVALAHVYQGQPATEKGADYRHATDAPPASDHCAGLRGRWPGGAPASSSDAPAPSAR